MEATVAIERDFVGYGKVVFVRKCRFGFLLYQAGEVGTNKRTLPPTILIPERGTLLERGPGS